MFYSVAKLDLVSMQLALQIIDINLISTAFKLINECVIWDGAKQNLTKSYHVTHHYFLKYTQVYI